MEEKITRSVRANKEVFQRIQEISKEKGMDQGATMEALLNAWDIQAAKGLVPERAADVADFDASIQSVQKAFLRSLDLAANAEQRARVSYQAQLDALAGSVARLEKELAEAQEAAKSATNELAEAILENGRLKQELANVGSVQAILTAFSAKLTSEQPEPKKSGKKRGAKPEAEAESEAKPEAPIAETIKFPKEAQA